MANFIVNRTFQFGGALRLAGTILEVDANVLKAETALGKHPTNGKYLSGLLNHCTPEKVAKEDEVKETDDVAKEDADALRLATIYAEMDEMGAAYDKRWKLPKLETELIKAKQIRGL